MIIQQLLGTSMKKNQLNAAFGAIMVGLVATHGCGGSDGIAQKDAESEFLKAFCDNLVKCEQFTTTAECIKGLDGFLSFDQLYKSIEVGKSTYDGEKFGECVDAFSAISCDGTKKENRESLAACRDAFKGKTAAGGMCTDSSQCASRRCRQTIATQACAVGVCDGDPGAAGASCAMSECNDGLFCDSTSQTCKALLASGASCTSSDECDYGLDCLGRICKTPPKTGESCPDGQCALAGDICDNVSNQCARVPKLGEVCAGNCIAPLSCDDVSNKCVAPAKLGEACTGRCEPGTFCSDSSMKCEVPKADGTACTGDAECSSRNCKQAAGSNMGTCEQDQLCL
jgi:hypothetical protein